MNWVSKNCLVLQVIETFGVIGSVLLASCGIPEAWKSFKTKRTELTWGFLLLWFFGEIFLTIYILPLKDWILYFNYFGNLFLISVMLYYKIKVNLCT